MQISNARRTLALYPARLTAAGFAGAGQFRPLNCNTMPKLKAKREGTLVYLPKYVNAEMLMLEFFRGDTLAISPQGDALVDGSTETHTAVQIHMHVDILDGLISYIDANTPND